MSEIQKLSEKVDSLHGDVSTLTKAMLRHVDNKQPSQAIYSLKGQVEHLAEKVDSGFTSVIKRQDYTNGKVVRNTEYRLKSEGILSVLKWLGASNVIVFIFYVGSLIMR